MPSHDAQKRPNLPHRQSSGSATFVPSSGEGAPTPAQRQRVTRFAVGQARPASRNTSHSKNINKLGKLAQARANDASASPKAAGLVKRNVSNIQLTRNISSTALRKNQSETSLRRNNRSNAQLAKLTRAGSSRNVTKATKRTSRTVQSQGQTQAADAIDKPTVRFDVGNGADDGGGAVDEEEGAWENYTDSRSPSTTRSSTPRRGSIVTSPNKPDRSQKEGNTEPPDISMETIIQASESLPTSQNRQPPNLLKAVHTHSSLQLNNNNNSNNQLQERRERRPDASRITSRLLRRNVSFNAPPQITSNSATPVIIGSNDAGFGSANTCVDSNPEVVSRFLHNPSSSSSSTIPRDSIFLPTSSKNSPEKLDKEEQRDTDAEDGPRRNKSMPDVAAMRVSRTQQKLNLERESVVREPQNRRVPPPSVLRASRFSSTNVPFYDVTDGALDGRPHPQLRHLFDQTNVEYRRVRMYQNPLVGAIGRLEDVGLVPRMRIAARQRYGRKAGLLSGSGDGAYGLSQSWRSHRSSKSADAKDKIATTETQANGHVRRPRVMFQGIDNSDERPSDGRQSLDGHQDQDNRESGRSQRDEARDLCRRLWQRAEAIGGAG